MQQVRGERFQPTPIPLSRPLYMRVIRGAQRLFYLPCRLITAIYFPHRVTVHLRVDDLNPELKYVVAANHQSMIDPFIICSGLPFALLERLGPFRYFAHTGLFENPVLRLVLLMFGGFPTRKYRHWPYGIEAARAYLGRRQTVMIFPEGRRSLPGDAPAREGVGVLAQDPSVCIIPAHLAWERRGWRRSYRLNVGRPLPYLTDPETILAAIYALDLPK